MKGNRVGILASGPSLDTKDIDQLRCSGVSLVAVNNTWEIARDCLALVAGDGRWWEAHGRWVDIPAVRVTRTAPVAIKHGAKVAETRLGGPYNSGLIAIEWVIQQGASQVILLGFDCSMKYGIHHHGAHEKTPNPDQKRLTLWHQQFAELRRVYPHSDIVNCSRHTELAAFPQASLEDVLQEVTCA